MLERSSIVAPSRRDECGHREPGDEHLRVTTFTRSRHERIDVNRGLCDRAAMDEHIREMEVPEHFELPSAVPLFPAHDLFGLLSELVPVSEVVQRTQALAARPHLRKRETARARELDPLVPQRPSGV
jgi:hypothetical protein